MYTISDVSWYTCSSNLEGATSLLEARHRDLGTFYTSAAIAAKWVNSGSVFGLRSRLLLSLFIIVISLSMSPKDQNDLTSGHLTHGYSTHLPSLILRARACRANAEKRRRLWSQQGAPQLLVSQKWEKASISHPALAIEIRNVLIAKAFLLSVGSIISIGLVPQYMQRLLRLRAQLSSISARSVMTGDLRDRKAAYSTMFRETHYLPR